MTVLQYAAGVVRLGAFALLVAFAARRLRRRLVGLDGPVGLLADLIAGLSLALLLAEGLGLISALRSTPLIAAALAVALAVGVGDRRRPTAGGPEPIAAPTAVPTAAPMPGGPAVARRLDRTTLAVVVAVAVVVGQWCLQTARALDTGMSSFDTIWYHMPFAAGFAQTASVTGLQYAGADPLVATFPENSELVHALGIVLLHSDFASPFLSLAWMGIALLAGWCIGAPWGRSRATLLAVALVLATPVMATTQPGQPANDILGLAMFLAAAALVVRGSSAKVGEVRPRELALAGLAVGFALGTKVTLLVPGLALLALAVAAAPRARRVPAGAACAAGIALTGSFWYLRNLVEIGNPFGVLHLRLGPLELAAPDSPLERIFHYSLLGHLDRTDLWTSRLAPGLDQGLGPLWWAILAAAALGAVAVAVRPRHRTLRPLALTAVASAVGYAALPTSASFLATTSATFAQNLRYATPALALGLVLLVCRPRTTREGPLVAVLAAAILVTQLGAGLWPDQPGRHALAAALALAAAAGIAAAARRRPRSRPVLLAAPVVLLAAAGGFFVQRHYQSHRYQAYTRDAALGRIFRWAQDLRGARIAVAGTFLSYPLYGRDLSNHVVYVGRHGPHDAFGPAATCDDWRLALARGRFDYVVVTPPLKVLAAVGSPELRWTADDPAAAVTLAAGPGYVVFRLTRPLHRCPPTAPLRS